MAYQLQRPLDEVDWAILKELQTDGRLSYNELGRRVSLSSPAVAERVRRLEEAGVIAGYHARIDAGQAGYPVTAFIEMRCEFGHCLLKNTRSDEFPEIAEIHKVTGDRCVLLRIRATSTEHLEGLLERLGKHGEARSSMVLSTLYDGRPVSPPSDDFSRASRPDGWR